MSVRGDPGFVAARGHVSSGRSSQVRVIAPRNLANMLRGFDLDWFSRDGCQLEMICLSCSVFLSSYARKTAGESKEEVVLLEAQRCTTAGCETLV